jgi:hypothetical protein
LQFGTQVPPQQRLAKGNDSRTGVSKGPGYWDGGRWTSHQLRRNTRVEPEASAYTLALPPPTLNRFVLSKLRLMEKCQNTDPFKYILDSARIGEQTQAMAK